MGAWGSGHTSRRLSTPLVHQRGVLERRFGEGLCTQWFTLLWFHENVWLSFVFSTFPLLSECDGERPSEAPTSKYLIFLVYFEGFQFAACSRCPDICVSDRKNVSFLLVFQQKRRPCISCTLSPPLTVAGVAAP